MNYQNKLLRVALHTMFSLMLSSGCSNAASNKLPPAGWTRVTWNPNRDCGYSVPIMPAYVQPDVSYTLDIPKNYYLKQAEGSSMIWMADSSKPAVIQLYYWGDKQYRENNKWAQTTFPHPHGFNWLDARKECEYRISVIKKESDDKAKIGITEVKKLKPTSARTISYPRTNCLIHCKPITLQNINGISFWRADLEIPAGCPSLVSTSYNHHAVIMLSDNGTDLMFDGSNPIAEKIIASICRQ